MSDIAFHIRSGLFKFIPQVVLLTFLTSLIVACSVVSPRMNANSGPSPAIRDVPFSARDGRDMNPRKRIMVLPFVNAKANGSDRVTMVTRDTFLRTLRMTNSFVVISNDDFPKDISTYLKNGEYDLEEMAKLAGGMGLAVILEGRILDIKARRIGDEVGLVRKVRARIEATVRIRLVNTKNGGVIVDETRSAQVEDSTTRWIERTNSDRFLEEDPKLIEAVVSKAFYSTIPRIVQSVEKLSWEGKVALVKGDRIYLNAGRLSGLQVGDILKVTEEGQEVFDPETGALIGTVPGRLKGTIEVVSYFGKDGAIGIIHSGSGFRENDRVELY